jgi:hypothetical protein
MPVSYRIWISIEVQPEQGEWYDMETEVNLEETTKIEKVIKTIEAICPLLEREKNAIRTEANEAEKANEAIQVSD